MSTESIERIENLIRVVSIVPDDKFDICRWYNPITKCGCAIGHAMNDAYFIARRLELDLGRKGVMEQVGDYFGITAHQAGALFITRSGYGSRRDVLAALRVLLLEKMVQEIPTQIEPAAATEAELELI